MKFIREVYEKEILPSLKQLFIAIVRGIKGFFGKLLHVIENPWSSITGIASQKDEIFKAFQVSDWFSFAQGILLVLGALAIYDSPIKNWGVIKGKISPSPTPPIPPEPTDTEVTDTQVIEVQVLPKIKPKPQATAKPPLPALKTRPKLPYEDLNLINKESFIDKVHEVANRLSIKPAWLMIVIWIECKFNRGIVNTYSGTVGLIQWTISNVCKFWNLPKPYIAKDKKGRIIITPEIKRIHKVVQDTPGVEQLEKVFEYLEPYIGKMKTLHDVYLAIFYPAAIGRNDNFVLGSERSIAWMKIVYAGNKNLDMFGDRDGLLEVSDVKAWVEAHIPQKFKGKL
jgi:hypothetical protein